MAPPLLLLYGANGYTGALIAREAVRRGLRPVLAGRSPERLRPLAAELGCEVRAFGLGDPAALREGLRGAAVVLHCAGPFSATAAPMLRACLEARVHYLDVSGEIAVLEHALLLDASARQAGIALCPGAGFDVVPTDCVAAALHEALPDATALALAFDSRSPVSPGTARTMVEGLAGGSKVRREGAIVTVPLGALSRAIDFGEGPRSAVAIAWGDVSTAWHTTRIPSIEVYVPLSPRRIRALRRTDWLRPLLGLGPVRRFLQERAGRRARGPDEAVREAAPVRIWGEARNAAGAVRTARLRTANGYTVTVHAALAIAERLLAGAPPAVGAYTPSQLMGTRFVEGLPGSGRIEIS